MEISQAIEKRRSIRLYTSGKIPNEDIESIVHAGEMAPSWKNTQVPRYYAVKSAEMKRKLKECLPARNSNNTRNASCFIVICFEKGLSGYAKNGSPDNEVGGNWGYFDCGLACQNMALKAYDMGYGTLVMGVRDEKKIRDLLSVPPSQSITAILAIGHPAIDPSAPRRKPVKDILKIYE